MTTYFLLANSSSTSDEYDQPLDTEIIAEQTVSNCTADVEIDQVSWEDHSVFTKLALGAVALGIIFQGKKSHHSGHVCGVQVCTFLHIQGSR